jgi:hypothetical protein
MKLDGHLIKNGVKLCASSIKKFHKHEFGPHQIRLPEKGYSIELKGLPLDDFRFFLEYFFQNKLLIINHAQIILHIFNLFLYTLKV